MTVASTDIAIVGGGVSGVLLAAELPRMVVTSIARAAAFRPGFGTAGAGCLFRKLAAPLPDLIGVSLELLARSASILPARLYGRGLRRR